MTSRKAKCLTFTNITLPIRSGLFCFMCKVSWQSKRLSFQYCAKARVKNNLESPRHFKLCCLVTGITGQKLQPHFDHLKWNSSHCSMCGIKNDLLSCMRVSTVTRKSCVHIHVSLTTTVAPPKYLSPLLPPPQ